MRDTCEYFFGGAGDGSPAGDGLRALSAAHAGCDATCFETSAKALEAMQALHRRPLVALVTPSLSLQVPCALESVHRLGSFHRLETACAHTVRGTRGLRCHML